MTIAIAVTVDQSGAISKIEQVSGKARDELKKTQGFMDGLVQGIGQSIGSALLSGVMSLTTAVPHLLTSGVAQVVEMGGALTDMSAKTGMAVEALQELQFAGDQSGVAFDTITAAASKMQQRLVDAPAAFERLGLSVSQLRDMDPGEQFETVADRLAAIEDPAERSAGAMAVFSKAGADLLPMVGDLGKLRAEAEALGIVMEGRVTGAADDLGDTADKLSLAWDGLLRNFGAAAVTAEPLHVLLEGLIEILSTLSAEVRANEGSLRDFVSFGVVFVAEAMSQTVSLLTYVVDAWSGLRIMYDTVSIGIETLAGKFLILTDVLMGNTSAYQAGVAVRQLEEQAVERTNAAIQRELDANQERQAVLAKVTGAFASLSDRVAASAGQEHVAEQATRRHTGAHLAAAGATRAHEQALKALASMMADVAARIASADRVGLPGLEAALAGVEADLDALRAKIPEALSAAEVAPLLEALGELGERLRANAIDAERQRVLGRTLNDAAVEAANVIAVYQQAGVAVTELVTEDLRGLEEHIQALIDASPELEAVLGSLLGTVREEMTARGVLTDAERRRLDFENAMRDALLDQAQAAIRARQALSLGDELADLGSGIADLLDAIGGGEIASAIDAALDLGDAFESAAEDGMLTWGEMASLVGKTVDAFKRVTESANAAKRAIGGALVGAQAGAQIGSMVAGPLGAGIGAGAGAIIGGVLGLFRTPGWVKAGREAGRVLGVAVSQELAKQIEQTAKKLKIDFRGAALLHLDKAMADSGLSASAFTGQLGQLMQAIANGSVPAREGLEALGRAFGLLADEARRSTTASIAMFDTMRQARQLGVMTEEMRAWSREQSELIAKGLAGGIAAFTEDKGKGGRLLSGIVMVSEADARAQATIFSAQFWQAVKDQGPVAAADAFRDTFERLFENMTTVMPADQVERMLGPIRTFMELTRPAAGDEGANPFRAAAEGAQAFADVLRGQINSGLPMAIEQFRAFEQTARTAFAQARNAAVEAGMSAEDANTQAYLAIAPMLQNIQAAASAYGFALDEGTKAMVEQAKAAGVAFATTPIDRAASAMERVADVLERVYGAAKGTADEFDRMGGAAGGITVPEPGPRHTYTQHGTVPSYAGGGIYRGSSTGGLAMLHGTEAVLGLPQLYGTMASIVAATTAQHLAGYLAPIYSAPTPTAQRSAVAPAGAGAGGQGLNDPQVQALLAQLVTELRGLRRDQAERPAVQPATTTPEQLGSALREVRRRGL